MVSQLSNKTVAYVLVIVLGLIVIWCMTSSPYTPTGKIGICRHELSAVRAALLFAKERHGLSFAEEQAQLKGNALPLKDLVHGCCVEYAREIGAEIFHYAGNRANRIVDPWGMEYNISSIESLNPSVRADFVRRISVGGVVVWSSGPNRVNECGAGDDVFELKLPQN